MNCKPGDIAIIVAPVFSGMMVEVLYVAPTDPHVLPNGRKHKASEPGSWVLKSLGEPFSVKEGYLSMYGAGHDRYLHPLRGDVELQEIAEELCCD